MAISFHLAGVQMISESLKICVPSGRVTVMFRIFSLSSIGIASVPVACRAKKSKQTLWDVERRVVNRIFVVDARCAFLTEPTREVSSEQRRKTRTGTPSSNTLKRSLALQDCGDCPQLHIKNEVWARRG